MDINSNHYYDKPSIGQQINQKILLLDGSYSAPFLSSSNAYNLHCQYLDAGADIVTTNTFSLIAKYLHPGSNTATIDTQANDAIKAAIKAATERSSSTQPRYVFGSIGQPSPQIISETNSDKIIKYYKHLSNIFLAEKIDALLLETIYDFSCLESELIGLHDAMLSAGRTIPIIVSITPQQSSNSIHSGETFEQIINLVEKYSPLAIGINCGFGASRHSGQLKLIKQLWPSALIYYPSAGIPDINGTYPITATQFANEIKTLLNCNQQLRIVGGCCGCGPNYIKLLRDVVDNFTDNDSTVLPSEAIP